MPEFTNAFSGLKEDRKLTHDELVRAIRFMIAAEYESIQLYTQLAVSIDDKLAQEVLWDISNEEKEHAGEFLRLLQVLAPDEQGFYDEGMGRECVVKASSISETPCFIRIRDDTGLLRPLVMNKNSKNVAENI